MSDEPDLSEWEGEKSMLDDPQEREHIYSVLDSFIQYRRVAHHNTTHKRRQNFYALPSEDWTFLSTPPISYLDTLSKVDDAIDVNADLAEAISTYAIDAFSLPGGEGDLLGTATELNLDKARSTVSQLYRDWSAEGQVERSACYDPVFQDLEEAFRLPVADDEEAPRILVPGAGLGRFVFELQRKGYHVVGNEVSYHQAFAGAFMLNGTFGINEWAVHPWALSFANNLSRENQLRSVLVPDVDVRGVERKGSMNMVMGDFSSVFAREEWKNSFDAIATVFFIDTAPNVLKYIKAVKNCLKEGGRWINVGPLHWHFGTSEGAAENESEVGDDGDSQSKSDKVRNQGACELTNDEVLKLVQHAGFDIKKSETKTIGTGYIQNPKSMLQSKYWPSHWVAAKKTLRQ